MSIRICQKMRLRALSMCAAQRGFGGEIFYFNFSNGESVRWLLLSCSELHLWLQAICSLDRVGPPYFSANDDWRRSLVVTQHKELFAVEIWKSVFLSHQKWLNISNMSIGRERQPQFLESCKCKEQASCHSIFGAFIEISKVFQELLLSYIIVR